MTTWAASVSSASDPCRSPIRARSAATAIASTSAAARASRRRSPSPERASQAASIGGAQSLGRAEAKQGHSDQPDHELLGTQVALSECGARRCRGRGRDPVGLSQRSGQLLLPEQTAEPTMVVVVRHLDFPQTPETTGEQLS